MMGSWPSFSLRISNTVWLLPFRFCVVHISNKTKDKSKSKSKPKSKSKSKSNQAKEREKERQCRINIMQPVGELHHQSASQSPGWKTPPWHIHHVFKFISHLKARLKFESWISSYARPLSQRIPNSFPILKNNNWKQIYDRSSECCAAFLIQLLNASNESNNPTNETHETNETKETKEIKCGAIAITWRIATMPKMDGPTRHYLSNIPFLIGKSRTRKHPKWDEEMNSQRRSFIIYQCWKQRERERERERKKEKSKKRKRKKKEEKEAREIKRRNNEWK